ncbi:MAG: hypothetical protein ABH823_03370 [bacterium]
MEMKYNKIKHNRRSIRLRNYDYSLPGAYFVTICVHNRECLFGDIENGKMADGPPRGTSKTIGAIIRGYKIGVTKWLRNNSNIYHVWQRNYYEHIVRDNGSLDRIRKYIAENPAKWISDKNNPDCVLAMAKGNKYVPVREEIAVVEVEK